MSTSNMPNRALRYYRERQNWTQEQAAEALLALCGPGKRGEVNARMISKWERGVQVPSLEYREKLCKLYDVQSSQELGFIRYEDADYNGPRNLNTKEGVDKIYSEHDEKTVYSRF